MSTETSLTAPAPVTGAGSTRIAEGGVSVTVDVRLLGLVEVRVDDEVVALRGDIPKALVSRLALSAGDIVPAEELIADVWPQPPANVLSTLRAHLSRLRAAGLGAHLVGARGGYSLDVPADRVDLLRLRAELAAAGRLPASEERLSALGEIAARAARDPLPGLDAIPFVSAVRARHLADRRLLEEDLGEQALDLGDAALATSVLAGTAQRHPFDERPVRLLATALARSARIPDALTAIDAFTTRLRDDRGLDPSPRLQSLRASIVRMDPEVVTHHTGAAVRRVGVGIPLTRFVGRADDLARLRERRRDRRLITIVGPAGVGKTRTAVELAREATTALDDEQYMVDLADFRQPDEVVAAIAAVVRARELTMDAIVRRLRSGRILLLLDNADHVLGALAVAVDRLLQGTDGVRIVVTSREPLRLSGEEVVVLRPLVGEAHADAWRLFAERAADARGGYGFDDGELDDARALCAELEGIPLALELAAARLDVLDAAQVREGIGAHASTRGRHDSVRTAIDWTFGQLSDAQRELVQETSRFAGAFTVGAVSGASGRPWADTVALLDELVGKSLLAVERGSTGRRRFRMLESTREYLAEREDPARAAMWRLRYRWWFADLTTSLGPTLRTFEARDSMAVLDDFRADLTEAFETAVAAGDRDAAVRLAAGQAQYWFLRGLMVEGRSRLERALELPGDPTPLDGIAWLELANLAYQTGDAAAGFGAIARARAEGERLADPSVTAVALAREAYGRAIFGQADVGETLLAQARHLTGEAQAWARAEVSMSEGQIRRAQGRTDDALRALSASYRIAASIGYTWMITTSKYVAAKTLVDARRPKEAIDVAVGAVDEARANEDAAGALAVVFVIAGACAFVERHETGARLLGAVEEIGRQYDYSTAVVEGEDAERLRDSLSAGMTPPEFAHQYEQGRRCGWPEVRDMLARLPRREFSMAADPSPEGASPADPDASP